VEVGVRELSGRAVEHEPALLETEDAVGVVLRALHLVEGGDDGNPRRHGDPAQCLHHQAAVAQIEAGHGLVSQHDGRLLGQDFGDGHSLLLAAGQRIGALPDPVEEAHVVEAPEGHGPLARVEVAGESRPARPAMQAPEPPDEDVVDHSQPPHEVELLVDHPDARAVGAKGAPAETGEAPLVEADDPAADGRRTGETAKKGGFAGTGLPDHGDELSRIDRGGDVHEGRPCLARKDLGHAVECHRRGSARHGEHHQSARCPRQGMSRGSGRDARRSGQPVPIDHCQPARVWRRPHCASVSAA
jgi:hypothetical protein